MGLAGNVDCTYTNHINFKPTIATTLSATTVNLGDTIHDSATLTGASPTAGGTVTYHAYAGQKHLHRNQPAQQHRDGDQRRGAGLGKLHPIGGRLLQLAGRLQR
jgi:hypothetical protein